MHIHMLTRVNCALEVTRRHSNFLQGVQAFLSASQSHYWDVFKSRTLCLCSGVGLRVLYDTTVSDRNLNVQNKEEQNRLP